MEPNVGPTAVAADLVSDLEYQQHSPHATWQRHRHDEPVAMLEYQQVPIWSLTRHADVASVLREHRVFSSEQATMLPMIHGDPGAGVAMNLLDDDRHRQLRQVVTPILSRAATERMAAEIRKHVHRAVLDRLIDAGPVDVASLLRVLPMVLSGSLLGIPETEWSDVSTWAQMSIAPGDPEWGTTAPADTRSLAHMLLLGSLNRSLMRQRDDPTDNLVGRLARAVIGGRPLSDDEVLVNAYTLAMGASITTGHVATHFLLHMARHAPLWDEIRTSRQPVDTVVEEALRWASPTNHVLRRTTRDVQIAGVDIPAHSVVAAWVASANRDGGIFSDPFTFDPWRSPNPHLGFGGGLHYCAGAHLARKGLGHLVEGLRARASSIRLVGEPRHLRSTFINGIQSMTVEVSS